jgi:hypothetical protein
MRVHCPVVQHWIWLGLHGKHVFCRRVLSRYLTTSCSTVHREHSSYCCVFVGTCILSSCLAVGRYITINNHHITNNSCLLPICKSSDCRRDWRSDKGWNFLPIGRSCAMNFHITNKTRNLGESSVYCKHC